MRKIFLALAFILSPALSFAARVAPSNNVESYVTIRDSAVNGLEIGRLRPGESAELIEIEDPSYLIKQDNGSFGYVSLYWTKVIEDEGNKNLSLHFIDVGNGDSSLIVCPDNSTILIDSGLTNENDLLQLIAYLSEVLGPNKKTIDSLFVTHSGQHYLNSATTLLESFTINHTYSLAENNIASEFNCGGAAFNLLSHSSTVETEVDNVLPFVLKVQYEDFSAILSSNVSREIEENIINQYSDEFLKIDVLKINNQNDGTTVNSEAWINAVKPYIAVLSNPIQNSEGYPDSTLIERLTAYTISEEQFEHTLTIAKKMNNNIIWGTNTHYQELVYSTADSGNIIVVSSGQNANVFTRAHTE